LNKTSIIIIIVAHRLSTIRQCDLIYVFDSQCHIIESGTDETLQALRGVYYRMRKSIIN
jgi:ATP-binding cassette subfamily B protein